MLVMTHPVCNLNCLTDLFDADLTVGSKANAHVAHETIEG
jgi:hypothetical protein